MERRTKDINEVLVTASYYTNGFDLNLIKHISQSLLEGRNRRESFSFFFSLDREVDVEVTNLPNINALVTTCKKKDVKLVIEQLDDVLSYKRYENGEIFIFTLAHDNKEFVIDTSSILEKGIKLEKKC